MEAADDASGPFRHQLLQLAKLHARPGVIYCSSKAEPELQAILRAPLAAGVAPASAEPAADGAPPRAPGEFDVRPERAVLFLPRQARSVLEALHVRGMPPGLSTRERLHRLNAMLSLSSEQQVCAAGALLAVLAREGRLGGGGGDAGEHGGSALMCVDSISEVSLDG